MPEPIFKPLIDHEWMLHFFPPYMSMAVFQSTFFPLNLANPVIPSILAVLYTDAHSRITVELGFL